MPKVKKSKSKKHKVKVPIICDKNSNVFVSNPNQVFESTIWSHVSQLIKTEKRVLKDFYPNGISSYGELTLVGKTRTRLSSNNIITDQVGEARKSTQKLQVCHLNKVYNLESFYCLNFANKDCFEWKPVRNHNMNNYTYKMPSYALKLGIDTLNQSCLYVGRSFLLNKTTRHLGTLITSNRITEKNLIVINNEDIVYLDEFEILCLKPSPAKLKDLCRNQIRSIMSFNNEKIKKLDFLLESSLIKYIKFSSHLKCGRELRPGQSIVSNNNIYRLSLELDGRLVYYINENKDYLCLYKNVENLWFNELGLVVCFETNLTSKFFLDNFVNYTNGALFTDSRLSVLDNGNLSLSTKSNNIPNIIIQFRDDITSFLNSKEPKFDFVFFFEDVKKRSLNEENQDDETMKDNESSDSDSSSTSSSYTSGSSESKNSESSNSADSNESEASDMELRTTNKIKKNLLSRSLNF